jgi:hypothetical protein
MFLDAISVSVVSIALAIVLRAFGVIPLERLVFSLGLSLALLAAIKRNVNLGTYWPLIAVSLVALLLGALLLPFYRYCRKAKGGDAMALVMSFALMNMLAIFANQSIQGRSIPTRLSGSQTLAGAGFLIIVLSVRFFLEESRLETGLKLYCDASAFLRNFVRPLPIVLLRVEILSTLLAFIGVLGFLVSKENFSMQRLHLLLIPSFAACLASRTLKIEPIVLTALSVILVSYAIVYLFGNSILVQAYQAALFIVVVLLQLVIEETKQLNWRRKKSKLSTS